MTGAMLVRAGRLREAAGVHLSQRRAASARASPAISADNSAPYWRELSSTVRAT